MTIFDFFSLLGGVGLFLFGMTLMGDGLKRVSGDKPYHPAVALFMLP